MALVPGAPAAGPERIPEFLIDARMERDFDGDLTVAAEKEPPELPTLTENHLFHLRQQAAPPRNTLSADQPGPLLKERDAMRRTRANGGTHLYDFLGNPCQNEDPTFKPEHVDEVLRVAVATHCEVQIAFMHWLVGDEIREQSPRMDDAIRELKAVDFDVTPYQIDPEHDPVQFAIATVQFNRLAGLRTLREYLRCPQLKDDSGGSERRHGYMVHPAGQLGQGAGLQYMRLLYLENGPDPAPPRFARSAPREQKRGALAKLLLDTISNLRRDVVEPRQSNLSKHADLEEAASWASRMLPVACGCIFFIYRIVPPTFGEAKQLVELIRDLAEDVHKWEIGSLGSSYRADVRKEMLHELRESLFALTMSWVEALGVSQRHHDSRLVDEAQRRSILQQMTTFSPASAAQYQWLVDEAHPIPADLLEEVHKRHQWLEDPVKLAAFRTVREAAAHALLANKFCLMPGDGLETDEGMWSRETLPGGIQAVLRVAMLHHDFFRYERESRNIADQLRPEPQVIEIVGSPDVATAHIDLYSRLLSCLEQRVFSQLDNFLVHIKTARAATYGHSNECESDAREAMLEECGDFIDRFLQLNWLLEKKTKVKRQKLLPSQPQFLADPRTDFHEPNQDCVEQLIAFATRWCVHAPRKANLFFTHHCSQEFLCDLACMVDLTKIGAQQHWHDEQDVQVKIQTFEQVLGPFIRLMTAIAAGGAEGELAEKVAEFLEGKMFVGGYERDLPKLWDQWLRTVLTCASQVTTPQRPSFAGVPEAPPPPLADRDQQMLIIVLQLLMTTFNSRERMRWLDNRATSIYQELQRDPQSTYPDNRQPLPISLMQLVCSPSCNPDLKGALLQALAKITELSDEAQGSYMWGMLEQSKICAPAATTDFHDPAAQSNLGMRHILANVESGSYPISAGFCELVAALLSKGQQIDQGGYPSEQVNECFNFVVDEVLLKLHHRQYSSHHDRWHLASAALSVVYAILKQYRIGGAGIGNYGLLKDQLGYKIMEKLLLDRQDHCLLHLLLGLLHDNSLDGEEPHSGAYWLLQRVEQNTAAPLGAALPGEAEDIMDEAARRDAKHHEKAVLLSLQIMLRAVNLQTDFESLVANAPPGAMAGRATLLSPDLLVHPMNIPKLTSVAQYVGLHQINPEIACLAVQLLAHVSAETVGEDIQILVENISLDGALDGRNMIKPSIVDILEGCKVGMHEQGCAMQTDDEKELAKYRTALRDHVLQLLLHTVEKQPPPNVAFWLLGLYPAWHPQEYLPQDGALHVIVEGCIFGGADNTDETAAKYPRVAEQCQKLVYCLCREGWENTGKNLLTYLQYGYLENMVRAVFEPVYGNNDWMLKPSGKEDVSTQYYHSDSATVSRCNWVAWSIRVFTLWLQQLQMVAIDHTIHHQLQVTLEFIFSWMRDGKGGADITRAPLLKLLEEVADKPVEGIELLESVNAQYASSFAITSFSDDCKSEETKLIDVERFVQLLRDHFATKDPGQVENQIVVPCARWAVLRNQAQMQESAEVHVFSAWQELVTMAFKYYHVLHIELHSAAHRLNFQRRMYAVLNKVVEKLQQDDGRHVACGGGTFLSRELRPWKIPLVKVAFKLSVLIRDAGREHEGFVEAGHRVPIDLHRTAFENLVVILASRGRNTESTFEYRSIAYATLVTYLQHAYTEIRSSPPQDHVFRQELEELLRDTLRTAATKLVRMMAADATEASEAVQKTVALSALSMMLRVLGAEALPSLDHYFGRFFEIFRRQDPHELTEQQQTQAWSMYNCTMGLLLSISKIKGGARELLKYGVVKSMTQNGLFQEGAAVAMPVGIGGLPTQRQRVLPALRLLLCMATELSQNCEFTEQLVVLLETHFPLFDPVLTSIVSPNMRFTLADMEQAQNIAGLLAHVARRQGQELLQYQDHMLGLLQCLGERDFATLQRSSDPVWWHRVDPQANEVTAPLPDDMKPTWVQPPAGPWSEFDNLKINAAVALMAEVSAFCRIRVPAPRSGPCTAASRPSHVQNALTCLSRFSRFPRFACSL